MEKVSMSSPDINDQDRKAVQDVLNTPNLSMGEKIVAFEDAFKRLTGLKHAIGVNSGTAGLHLCVRAAGIEAGDLVITTPFSFVSSTNVLLFEKAIPVYVDVERQTGNIDPTLLEQAADDLMVGGGRSARWLPRHLPARGWETRGSLKALLPVDVFGQPADYDAILPSARRYGLQVIEDSCEALGAEYKGHPAGTLGDSAVFAFYPNKQITTGEGGMIVTDDDGAARLMNTLRNQGRAPGDTWLDHTYLGYNYRLDEMSAALGVTQMARLESLLNARQQVADWYAQYLAGIDEITPPALVPNTTRMSWFVYVIRISEKINRDAFARLLISKGVPVRPYFLPIHLQPYMREMFGYEAGDYPVTEYLGRVGLAIPFSGALREEQVVIVCQAIREALTNRVVLN
jgi:dTDP-4-amino-4,6-dideoxygalactose transaminase